MQQLNTKITNETYKCLKLHTANSGQKIQDFVETAIQARIVFENLDAIPAKKATFFDKMINAFRGDNNV